METYSSITDRIWSIMALRKVLMMGGTCGVSMLLTASFLKMISVFFYQIYS